MAMKRFKIVSILLLALSWALPTISSPSGDYQEDRKLQKNSTVSQFMGSHGIVIEEYKLMFMPVAKVDSSLIKRLLMKLNNNPSWCMDYEHKRYGIHHEVVNKLARLGSFSEKKQEEIMSSSNWTRAIFVREPKERALSAFTDKGLYEPQYMRNACCPQTPNPRHCIDNIGNFGYFLHVTQTYCQDNEHWVPIQSYVDEHWWPFIDFVGYSDRLHDDFQKLLQSLHSEKDGVDNAWERVGKTGWDLSSGCNETSNLEFGQQIVHTQSEGTNTSSIDKMKQYYTPALEFFVEEIFKKDWESPYYHFSPIKLF